MPKSISVIVLDIPTTIDVDKLDYSPDRDSEEYGYLTVDEKLDVITAHIDRIMSELEKNEPDVLHVITWREHGICGEHTKFVTNQEKNRIKEALSMLAQKYPSLVIVSGTLATTKHFDNFTLKEYEEIKASYETMDDSLKQDSQLKLHLEHLTKQKPTTTKDSEENQGVTLVQNTCYIFQGENIQRHDKTSPYLELKDYYKNSELTNAVFRPGRNTTKNPIVYVMHPNGKDKVSLGIEICYEHQNGILKRYAMNNRLDLHFILADTTPFLMPLICSNHVIYADAYYKPKMILAQPSTDKDPIQFFCVNGVLENSKLSKPIDGIYPFEKMISDLIADAINRCSKNHVDYNLLIQMKAEWDKMASACKYNNDFKIDDLLKRWEGIINQRNLGFVDSVYSLFYFESPVGSLLTQLTDRINEFITKTNENRAWGNYKDILSTRSEKNPGPERKTNLQI